MHWFQSPARQGNGLTPSGASQLSTAGIDFFTCLYYDEILLYRQDKNIVSRLINQEIRQEIISFLTWKLSLMNNMKQSKSKK